MNELYYTLYDKDLSTKVLATNLKVLSASLETQLHGGFGRLSGMVQLSQYDRYKWYSDYLNTRMLVRNKYNEVAWEGRVEDIQLVPGFGVAIDAYGYWRNFFDIPLRDEDTWDDDGPYYPEDIIQEVIDRCCRQIRKDYTYISSTDRDVAPFKLTNYRYPGDIVQDLLRGGDNSGNIVYFAVWEDRLPWMFTKEEEVDWYVRLKDFSKPPQLRRSMDIMANAVIAEYSVEGQAGDANDDGTATGERGNNYITLTDTAQEWDEGQWNSGFDIAIVSGTGSGQVRDILDTRTAPTIIDSGQCIPFVAGISTLQAGSLDTTITDNTNTEMWGNGTFTWDVSDGGELWIDIIDGPCAGKQRLIESDYANFEYFHVSITPAWSDGEAEGWSGPYPGSPTAGSDFIVYRPSSIVTQGKSWVVGVYNTGHMVQIVRGRGAGQKRKITDTKQIKLNGVNGDGVTLHRGVWDVLIVEDDWDIQPDETSFFEVWEESVVVDAGKATSGTHNTLTDTSKTWTVGGYDNDYELVVITGACAGQRGSIIDTAVHTLTVDPLWDDDIPDDTTEYEIRVIKEEDDEEITANQLVTTSPWTTQPDSTSVYEVQQKEDGGTLERTLTRTAGSSVRDLRLARKKLLSLGTTTPADAERIVARTLKLLKRPQQVASSFEIHKVQNKNGVEFPLTSVRAGDVIEITDLFPGQAETDGLDALRRFYIIRTQFSQATGTLSITPDNVDIEIATLIASGMK